MIVLGNADCRQILRKIPDRSVDLVVADPPWGGSKYPWDRHVDNWIELIPRVLKPGGSMWLVTNTKHTLRVAPELAGWHYIQDIVIEHPNGNGVTMRPTFRDVHTSAIQFRPPGTKLNDITLFSPTGADGRILRSVVPDHGNKKKWHPHEQAHNVMCSLIEAACPVGGVVLEPFAGAGSVALAAEETGRSCLSVEIDFQNYEVMENRFQFLRTDYTTIADGHAFHELFGARDNGIRSQTYRQDRNTRCEPQATRAEILSTQGLQRPVRVRARLPRAANA